MVTDVLDELKDLADRLERFSRRPQPLLQLRTGELVTHDELTRRAEEQRRQVAHQELRGLHPLMVIYDEIALDPIF